MSDADTAYRAALTEIDRVRAAGEAAISFDKEGFRALDRIPEELAEIEGLLRVDLDNTHVTDLAPLAALTELRTLRLNRTRVKDLAPLAALTGLQALFLYETGVEDLAPLAGLTRLQTLLLNGTGVTDLAPLAALTTLQFLRLDRTGVTDLSPIAALTTLQYLRLDRTGVTDLAPLAMLTGLQTLRLDGTAVTNLAPVAALTGLQTLELNETKVTDLSPLAGLRDLHHLDLWGSAVADLRPLVGLENLGLLLDPGLTFENTRATARDRTLAELAGIEDSEERAEKTRAYLASLPPWPEPYTPTATPDGSPPRPIGPEVREPEQDPALPLIWGENGFEFYAQSLTADPVTADALDDLRALLEDLRRKGNRHDDLYRLAGELQERCAGEIDQLNMVRLHLSYQKLRRMHAAREGRTDGFDDETVSAMEGVLEILPGVTLSDDGVRVLIERQEANRAAFTPPHRAKAEAGVLEAIQTQEAPFAPDVQDAANAILSSVDNDRLQASRGMLAWNVVTVVGRWILRRADAILMGVAASWVWANQATLMAMARAMGSDVAAWFMTALTKLGDLLGKVPSPF